MLLVVASLLTGLIAALLMGIVVGTVVGILRSFAAVLSLLVGASLRRRLPVSGTRAVVIAGTLLIRLLIWARLILTRLESACVVRVAALGVVGGIVDLFVVLGLDVAATDRRCAYAWAFRFLFSVHCCFRCLKASSLILLGPDYGIEVRELFLLVLF